MTTQLLEENGLGLQCRGFAKCIELRVRVTRISNVLEFKQRPWLVDYIKFKTEKRMLADSEFKRSF